LEEKWSLTSASNHPRHITRKDDFGINLEQNLAQNSGE
jgi:hypothetical protein